MASQREPKPGTGAAEQHKPQAVSTVSHFPQQSVDPTKTQPKSDRYRVKGPGSLFRGNKMLRAGAVITLSDSEALTILEYIEQV